MRYYVFDVESDGLLEQATRIHCLCWTKWDGVSFISGTVTGKQNLIQFFSDIPEDYYLIGHNIIRYDIPLCNKLLGTVIKNKLCDTLGLSWYLYPERNKHGLESFGKDYNLLKLEVKDWKGSDVDLYIRRCERDVEINLLLWKDQLEYLNLLYTNRPQRIIDYITFKLDCAREQEEIGWRLDIEKCKQVYEFVLKDREAKVELLSNAMPEYISYKEVKKPAKMLKKDGTPSSAAAEKWYALLEALNLPEPENDTIRVEDKVAPGNPASQSQLKAWLDSLGWVPVTYVMRKSAKTHEIKKVAQISSGDGLCESVKLLYEKEPALEQLDGLFILNHRIGILKGFLTNVDKNGFLKAEVQGFTNTMRFQHTTIVNLPSVHKIYGKEIRGCLVAPDEYSILCGSDMTSLEDSTKQHYMFKHDPEYVKEMRTPGFDPHLDIAVLAGMLTPEQVQDHKDKKVDYSKIRKDAKQVNFSAVYGAGPPKISLTTGMSLQKAKTLHSIYWKRNWSVKKIAKLCYVVTHKEQMWLYNPVSRFFYSLRFDKDRFSTLNQSTGVYCFDTQVRNVRNKGYKLCGQFHDEIIFPIPKFKEEKVKEDLELAKWQTNDMLKLNITLGISLDFGNSYADIH